MKLWLIVEYGGRLKFNGWYIPDHQHGGVYGGPYANHIEALGFLAAYATKQAEKYEAQEIPIQKEQEITRIIEAHRIIEVEWPDTRHPDDPEA